MPDGIHPDWHAIRGWCVIHFDSDDGDYDTTFIRMACPVELVAKGETQTVGISQLRWIATDGKTDYGPVTPPLGLFEPREPG